MNKFFISQICDLNSSSLSKNDDMMKMLYLDTSSITNNCIESIQEIVRNLAPSRAKRKVKHNTIVYSTVRPNLKHFGILKHPKSNLVVSTGFTTLDIKEEFQDKIDPYYLFLLISNQSVVDYLSTMAESAVSSYPSINPDDIGNLKFNFPDINNQRNISTALENIDEKISLNTRMNAELEAMAKQLYEYWFVQFDFPDENGNPYKSSGGKMVYNSTLKREIPAGWDDCELKDLTEVINGATPLTTNIENYGDDIIWITPNDLSNQKNKFISCGERSISQKGYDSCSTSLMPAGSVLMSSRAPIGLMAIAEVDLCTNQGFKSFVPFDMSDNYFLYYYIQEHLPQIEQLGAGTTFREVSRDTMLKFPILKIYDRDLYLKWYEQVDAIGKEQINLLHQIRNLTLLRDSLLPMLMNGQVTVE